MTGPTSLRLLPELESSLRQLAGIRAVRVVTGPDRKPIEIHVLAARDKGAKQVVRDVQSLAMAEFDLEIDHRIVSVVQLDTTDEPAASSAAQEEAAAGEPVTPEPPAPTRLAVSSIAVETAASYAQVAVTLSSGTASMTGTNRGPGGAVNRPRIVARATLDALSQLVDLDAAEVEQAQVLDVGNRQVAVCTVQFVTQMGELVLSGSAVVRNDPADAVARAVLDALNRRIPA